MPRPIDMHDSVWIEDLTMLEVRDLIKAGKTTALILTGGIEENGPYLTTGKHNNVLKATGESIARALGNALVAPIVTLEPGNPLRPNLSPGTIVLSQATFQAVLTDMSNSLRSQGFTDVDHGRRQRRQPEGDAGGRDRAQRRVEGQRLRPLHSRVLQLRRRREVRGGDSSASTKSSRAITTITTSPRSSRR